MAGRPKGSVNKDTRRFKIALNKLLEKSADEMIGWLDRVAQENPKHAIDAVCKLAEYVHPKLARTELTGKDGDDLTITLDTILDQVDQQEKLPGQNKADKLLEPIDAEVERV